MPEANLPLQVATTTTVAELNPFGEWFITATWLVLLGLNLWCFRKLIKHPSLGIKRG